MEKWSPTSATDPILDLGMNGLFDQLLLYAVVASWWCDQRKENKDSPDGREGIEPLGGRPW